MDIQGLKDKILQLAIQGKLVEQDKNDEPASALLNRIKEERDKLVKEGKIRKPKKLPPIEEEEKPFDIPKGWEWVRLGEIIRIYSGKGLTSKNMIVEGNIPVYGGNGITGYHNDYNIEKPTIVIGRVGFYCGSIHLVTEKAWITDNAFITDYSEDNIYLNFLKYLLKGTNLRENDNATAQPVISGGKIYPIIVALPPLAEQKRIVEKVDELFALIDELDSNKEDLLEVINLTRNQVLQEAIQGKLVEQNPEDEPASLLLERIKEERDKLVKEGKIKKQKPLPEITEEEKPFKLPEGWEWVRLGEVGQIVGGGTPKTSVKEYWEGGTIPWLTPADLSNYKDKYISTGKRSITPLGLKESSAQLMPKGTVLFSSRAPIGYTVIAKNEISTNQGFKSCVPFIIEMNEYLYYYLVYSAKIINENASGTTFKEVSGAEVSNLILPLPPLTEQKRIVEKVDIIMDMLDELENEIVINI